MDRIEYIKEDITRLKIGAIVNAANNSLLGGGGVDGAIHRAAGPGLLEYCRAFKGCKTGEAKISPGFNLQAEFVIHTVGPVWQGGKLNEDSLLASCYFNSLRIASENNISSIAFPSISTGVYGFPAERAAKIAIREVKNFLSGNFKIERIVFVCFDEGTYQIYKSLLMKE